jgi:hypothetical protein
MLSRRRLDVIKLPQVAVCCGYAALWTPASADTGLAFALGWLETLSDFFRLLEVFGRGTPQEQASRYFSDRQRYPECCGHAEDAIFHSGRTCPLGNRDACCRIVQRLNFFLEGVVELRVHPGAAAHTAGFLKRDVFELNARGLFGHAAILLS